MPICNKCGRYHKKSHHRIHQKSCIGRVGEDKIIRHMRESKKVGKELRKRKDYAKRRG